MVSAFFASAAVSTPFTNGYSDWKDFTLAHCPQIQPFYRGGLETLYMQLYWMNLAHCRVGEVQAALGSQWGKSLSWRQQGPYILARMLLLYVLLANFFLRNGTRGPHSSPTMYLNVLRVDRMWLKIYDGLSDIYFFSLFLIGRPHVKLKWIHSCLPLNLYSPNPEFKKVLQINQWKNKN